MIDSYHLARKPSSSSTSAMHSSIDRQSSIGKRSSSAHRHASTSHSPSPTPTASASASASANASSTDNSGTSAAATLPHTLPEFEHFRQNSPLMPEFHPRTSGFFSQNKRSSLTQQDDAGIVPPLPAVSISAIPKPVPEQPPPRSTTDSFTLPLTFQEDDALKGQQLPVRLGIAPSTNDTTSIATGAKYKTRVGHGFYFYTPPPGATHQLGSQTAASSDLSITTSKLSKGSSSGLFSATNTISSAATSPNSLTPDTQSSGTADSGLSSRSFALSSRSRANSTAVLPKPPAASLSSLFHSSTDCWRPEQYFNVIHSRVKGKMREFVHHGFPVSQVPYWHGYNKETMDAELGTHLNVSLSLKGNTLRPFSEGARPCRVLDLGCGRGAWCLDVARDWNTSEFIGVDIVPIQPPLSELNDPDIERRVSWVVANFLDPLPFPDSSFDFVHMRFLLQAIPEDKWVDVLSEARRVLAPGGVLEVIEGNYIFFGHASLVDAQELKDLESGVVASKANNSLKLPKRLKVLRDSADAADVDAIEITLERMMHRRFINPAPLSVIPSNLVIPGFCSIANGNPRHLPVYAESSAQRAKARNKDAETDANTTSDTARSSDDDAKWVGKFTNRTQIGKQLKSQFKLPDNDLFSAFNIMQSLEYFSSSRELIWQEAEEEKRSMNVQSPELKPWDHTRGFGQGCVEALRPFAHPWKSKDQFFRALDNYTEAMMAVCDLDFILEKYLGWEQCNEELTVEGRKHAERQRKMSVSSRTPSTLTLETSMQKEAFSEDKIMALAALRQGAISPTAVAIAAKASQEAPARLQTTRMSMETDDSGGPRHSLLSARPAPSDRKKRKPSARPSSSAGALGSSTPHSSMTPRVRSFGRGGAGNAVAMTSITDGSLFSGSEAFGFGSTRSRKPATVVRAISNVGPPPSSSDRSSIQSTRTEREDGYSSIRKRSLIGGSGLEAHTEESVLSPSDTSTNASTYAASQRGRVGAPTSSSSSPVSAERRELSPSSNPLSDQPVPSVPPLPTLVEAGTRSGSAAGRGPASTSIANPVSAVPGEGEARPVVGSRSSSYVRTGSRSMSKPIALLGFYDCTGFLAIA